MLRSFSLAQIDPASFYLKNLTASYSGASTDDRYPPRNEIFQYSRKLLSNQIELNEGNNG
jgi:hypothetical protein